MKTASPLFLYAHDGKAFYKEIMKRLNRFPNITLAEFCEKADIEFSTAWRWNKEGRKPLLDSVTAVEKALSKLESAQTRSSNSGISPTAAR